MPIPLGPLRFRPIFKSALWGGRRIAEMLPGAPLTGPISEAWLLSDVDGNESVVAEGPFAGATLRELMRSHRAELALPQHESFPLLVKIIDACEPLSIQVHPNDEQAQRLTNQPRGKTEVWYILHAEPGSRVFAGLKQGVSRSEFESALAGGRIEECLHSFAARAGDCVYLPAGTIHAAGGGLTIFEVQQTSDLTFRLHDWGRVDAKTGQPRELQVELALQCVNFDQGPVGPCERRPIKDVEAGWEDEVFSPLFLDLRTTIETRESWQSPNRSRLLFGLDGEIIIRHANAETALGRNDFLLLPPIEIQSQPQTLAKYIDVWVSE